MTLFSLNEKKTAYVPKMPPFTTLADSIHLAESNMHADYDSVHPFEVRHRSLALILIMNVAFRLF